MLNSSANVDSGCHRMVVGREMLGAASGYSLHGQVRASLQNGKLHISIKKLSSEAQNWLMQIHRLPAHFGICEGMKARPVALMAERWWLCFRKHLNSTSFFNRYCLSTSGKGSSRDPTEQALLCTKSTNQPGSSWGAVVSTPVIPGSGLLKVLSAVLENHEFSNLASLNLPLSLRFSLHH